MNIEAIFFLITAAGLAGVTAAVVTALLLIPTAIYFEKIQLTSGSWFGLGVLPVVVGMSLFAITLLYGGLKSVHWISDHCLQHPGHPHICLTHIQLNPPGGTLYWFFVVGSLSFLLFHSIRLFISAHSTRSLLRSSKDSGAFRLLDSRIAGAFTTGLFLPGVYLTTEAEKLLTEKEQELVIAHESKHAQRRDPLRLMILRFCESLFPGCGRIRRNWQLAAEIECDRYASRLGFSADMQARTILKLMKSNRHLAVEDALVHYVTDEQAAVKQRVEYLMGHQTESSIRAYPVLFVVTLIGLLTTLFFFEIHHLTETFLGFLS